MKYFNKMNYQLLLLSLLIIAAPSCIKDHESINVNKKDISDEILSYDGAEAAFLLPGMMNNIVSTNVNALQTQQNLQAESYAGYLESPSPFIGNKNPMTYVTMGIWPNSWNISTNNVMNNWLAMFKAGYNVKYPDLYSIALIMKATAGLRLVDTFGPYPYSKYGTTAEPEFDSPKEAYSFILTDLDSAIANLQAAELLDPNMDVVRFAKWDRSSFNGEYTKWIKLANTIRLRMAIRVSVIDPLKAQSIAENAVSTASGGLIDDATGSFSVPSPVGVNPHYTMVNTWNDCRVSAAVVTYLQGFGDPRLPIYALPGTDPILNNSYRGIRPGVEKPVKTFYGGYSKYNVLTTTPVKVVDVAESYFLRAEGELRGWNMGGGTAQQWYEDGIRASFKATNASGVDVYLQSTTTQLDYVDPKRPDYNSPPLTDVTVKWDDGATFEQKLEKIIIQKWISMFPEGTEAWSEFRRTGYPKQYYIMSPQNPLLPLGTFIKRLTYPVLVASSNESAYNKAVNSYLGGIDAENVKFYWMK